MTELIIGREKGVEKPRLAICHDGQTLFYGTPGSVPKNVSREHCRITLGEDSKMLVEDITDNNFMYINGVDCKRRKNVSINDVIELGPSKYRLDLDAILKSIFTKQAYSIGHLKEVYDKFQKDKMDMQVKQGKMNAASMLPGIVSTLSMLLMLVWQSTLPRIILGTIAAGGLIFFFVYRARTAASNPKKVKELDEQFREEYVCPNPMCGHFLGATPYKELMKNKGCPYCRAKFKE